MPCKQAAVEAADLVEPLPRLLHAANTLVRTDAGWRAENTDVTGVGMALQLAGIEDVDAAVVLGAGGAAGAAGGGAPFPGRSGRGRGGEEGEYRGVAVSLKKKKN